MLKTRISFASILISKWRRKIGFVMKEVSRRKRKLGKERLLSLTDPFLKEYLRMTKRPDQVFSHTRRQTIKHKSRSRESGKIIFFRNNDCYLSLLICNLIIKWCLIYIFYNISIKITWTVKKNKSSLSKAQICSGTSLWYWFLILGPAIAMNQNHPSFG